jgi:ATP-dependent DNA ligase
MPLKRMAEPFDDADWVFEPKYDGFRALALIRDGQCQLVSRNGHMAVDECRKRVLLIAASILAGP